MPKKVAIIEDEAELAALLEYNLGRQGLLTRVIFLTARGDEVDRVLGLEIGGDDYVTKPFSPRELMARVKAHLRRGEQDEDPDAGGGLLRLGPFTLDRAAHRLCLRDEELQLTSTEFRLLEFFLMHP